MEEGWHPDSCDGLRSVHWGSPDPHSMPYTDSSRNELMFRNQNGEEVLHKETVRVYRNLRDGCWSIQRKIPGKGWRVWLRWDYVVLDNAHFVVDEKGRNRVRKEGKKYVHAYCYGTLMANTLGCNEHMVRVNYNPYRDDHFNTRHGEVYQANRVWLTHKGEVYCE